jgi:hypothetical protein
MVTKITKLASAALVTGAASVALASPAAAEHPSDPFGGGSGTSSGSGTTISADPGWEVSQVAAGALGGLVLAGAGVATVAGLRRHQGHLAHPA